MESMASMCSFLVKIGVSLWKGLNLMSTYLGKAPNCKLGSVRRIIASWNCLVESHVKKLLYLSSLFTSSSPTQVGLYFNLWSLLWAFRYLLCLQVLVLFSSPQSQDLLHWLQAPHSDHCARISLTQQYLTFISWQRLLGSLFWSLQMYPWLNN